MDIVSFHEVLFLSISYLLITAGVWAMMVVTPVEATTMVVMAVVCAAPESALVRERTCGGGEGMRGVKRGEEGRE